MRRSLSLPYRPTFAVPAHAWAGAIVLAMSGLLAIFIYRRPKALGLG